MAKPPKRKNPTANCELTSNKQLREKSARQTAAIKDNFPPGIAQPALRALYAANLTSLDQLTKVSQAELAALHGMGPKAINILHKALQAKGLNFRE